MGRVREAVLLVATDSVGGFSEKETDFTVLTPSLMPPASFNCSPPLPKLVLPVAIVEVVAAVVEQV